MHLSLVGPALAHLHSLLPAGEAAASFLGRDARLKGCAAIGVDGFQVLKAVPDANAQAGGNGSAKGSRLTHGGAIYGDADEVGLCLCEYLLVFGLMLS